MLKPLSANAWADGAPGDPLVEFAKLSRPALVAFAVIVVCLGLRVALMLVLGFGIDEAYTLVSARELHLSYFDHPPLHVWMTHAAEALFGETTMVRLPFVLLFAGTGWLLFLTTLQLYGANAAMWAVIGLNLSVFFTVSAGGWVVPDGILIFCLLAATRTLLPVLLFDRHPGRAAWRSWLLGGLWLGLAGLSKYNAVLIALGFVAYIATTPRLRRWLIHPAPYAGAGVAFIVILPALIWNARHAWVSFTFQSGRGLPHAGLHPSQMMAMVAGEVGLISPWIAGPLCLSMLRAWRCRRDQDRLLLTLSLPSILIFSVTPLWGSRGLPHWPMPGWLFAFPLLGSWIEEAAPPWFRPKVWAAWSAAAFVTIMLVALGFTLQGWASRPNPVAGMNRDPTLESLDWGALREAVSGLAETPSLVVTGRWMDAGKIALALGPDIQTAVFSDDPREFGFGPSLDHRLGQDALVIMPMALLAKAIPQLKPYFASLDAVVPVWLGRQGRHEIELGLIRAHRLLRPFPLPRGIAPEAVVQQGAER